MHTGPETEPDVYLSVGKGFFMPAFGGFFAGFVASGFGFSHRASVRKAHSSIPYKVGGHNVTRCEY